MPSRISYQSWVDDPDPKSDFPLKTDETENIESPRTRRVKKWVNRALDKLTPLEREVVVQHYLNGRSLYDISLDLEREPLQIVNVRRRAVLKLKKNLAIFVRREFVLKEMIIPKCILCNSPRRAEIDTLIRAKRKEETWRRIIGKLKSEYGIKITTPQVLIGHQKYHMED
ncbi:putative RNA polymerase flagellar operon sigma factor FliA [Candidatus Zixiibacteriota bacterium]|nr:putative RNA polymerase flagellar operon sigma factor FliA [candidate division Zixibacteria bacterium]